MLKALIQISVIALAMVFMPIVGAIMLFAVLIAAFPSFGMLFAVLGIIYYLANGVATGLVIVGLAMVVGTFMKKPTVK